MKRFKKLLFLSVGLLLCLSGCAGESGTSAPEDTAVNAPEESTVTGRFVSPDGDDGANGSQAHPFATVAHALSAAAPGEPVILKDGVYYETVTLPGGTEEAPVVLRAEHPGEATLTSSVPLSGPWTLYRDGIFCTDVSAVADRICEDQPQVFVDGDALVDARYPNVGPYEKDLLTAERGVAARGTDASQIVTDTALPTELAGARVVVWPGVNGMSAWDCDTSVIREVQGETLLLEEAITGTDGYTGGGAYEPTKGNAYYLVGSLALLDAPGEYYYDAQEKTLYVRMPQDDDPSAHAVSLRGSRTVIAADRTAYVTVSGLRVFGGGISMKDADHGTIENCTILYADHTAYPVGSSWSAETATTVSGSFNRVTGCEIAYTSYSGLTVSGSDTEVTNNYIHDTDTVGSNFAGIFIRQGERLTVSDNTVENSGRIHLYLMASGSFKDCVITRNRLKNHSCLTSDCGAIYTWSTDGGGTEISYNFVSCTSQNKNGAMRKSYAGIYLDNYCSNFTVHHNVVEGGEEDDTFGIRLNLTNTGIVCVNNTVVSCRYAFGMYGYPNDEADCSGSVFSNNLFLGNRSDIQYAATENGKAVSYDNALKDGALPVPFEEERRMESRCNLSVSRWDGSFAPTAKAVDAGAEYPGLTDGYAGEAPDIGALEGEDLFRCGATRGSQQ